ncbi:MAG: hypothetical protein K2W96_15915 [Gemmataceae bacterium]|nr:hypothetical protein [Gemmataceae bacterium]
MDTLGPESGDGALYWSGNGTQVWLYVDEHDAVVGYGSLCQSKWPDPAAPLRTKKLKRVPISLIPAVGLARRFQGGPPGAEAPEKYSSRIVAHLIAEARKHTDRQPFLGLYVHPHNEKAIRFYRRIGFMEFAQTYHHDAAGVDYQAMILRLADVSGG